MLRYHGTMKQNLVRNIAQNDLSILTKKSVHYIKRSFIGLTHPLDNNLSIFYGRAINTILSALLTRYKCW
jgi:hypothetical protein